MSSNSTAGRSPLVFFVYQERKVALLRPPTHEVRCLTTFESTNFQAAVDLAKATFPSLKPVPRKRITFSAVLVGYPDHGTVEIGPQAWEIASAGVDTFEVGIIQDVSQPNFDSPEASRSSMAAIVPTAPAAAGPPKVEGPDRSLPKNPAASTLTIRQMLGQITTLTDVRPSDTIGNLKQRIWSIEGIPTNNQRLIFSGKVLADDRSLSSYGVQDLSGISLVLVHW
ncbi:ribosomal 40S subunit protein S27A [Tulasnella sp. 408]|nr:ribosomal 40S subunit protein S27A [Tulasnella sp. 408]